MNMITSTSNSKVKWVRKLRNRRERDKSNLFYIEGLRVVTEAVQQSVDIEAIVFAPGLLSSSFGRGLVQRQKGKGITVMEVSDGVFQSVSKREGPQGIAAVVRQSWVQLEEVVLENQNTWIALDSVQDPGNLGTVMRTNDAVGGSGIILLDHTTDPYDLTTIRASMGAIFTQKLVRTKFEEFAAWKEKHKYPVVGTSAASAVDYQDVIYPDALILMMGSEREGLQQKHVQLCDNMVRIPMVGKSDSLNMAVASAVVLYEIYNQRRRRVVHARVLAE